MTKRGAIKEAVKVQKVIDGLVAEKGPENLKPTGGPGLDGTFAIDFSNSRWWQLGEIRNKPRDTEIVTASPETPDGAGVKLLHVVIPEAEEATSSSIESWKNCSTFL